jgi:hypothetical protein
VLISDSLRGDVDADLVDALARIDGVVTAEVVDEDGLAEVPLIEPNEIIDDEVRWHIKGDLWLTHNDRLDAYFAFIPERAAIDVSSRAPDGIDLAAGEALLLIRALLSMHEWRLELQQEFAHAAMELRRSLQAPVAFAPPTAGSRRATLAGMQAAPPPARRTAQPVRLAGASSVFGRISATLLLPPDGGSKRTPSATGSTFVTGISFPSASTAGYGRHSTS